VVEVFRAKEKFSTSAKDPDSRAAGTESEWRDGRPLTERCGGVLSDLLVGVDFSALGRVGRAKPSPVPLMPLKALDRIPLYGWPCVAEFEFEKRQEYPELWGQSES